MTSHKTNNRRKQTYQPLRNLVNRVCRALRLTPTEDAADAALTAIAEAETKARGIK